MTHPTLGSRPGDQPVTFIANRRPAPLAAPTTDERLGSIEDRLDRIEAVAREVLDGLTALSARLDKDADR